MIIPYVSLAFAIIGACIYLLSTHAKAAEVGRLLLLAGLIALAFATGNQSVLHIGHS